MQIELFKAALKQTQTTWQRYMAAYCLLQLGFVIDLLGGASFLVRHQAIELAGFKVVREAISLTYAVLFLTFVVVALLESRILKQGAEATDFDSAVVRQLPDLQLWLVSPFSTVRLGRFRVLRFVFWLLFWFGFVTLAFFSAVHLLPQAFLYFDVLKTEPQIGRPLFKKIGWFALAVLLLCIPMGRQIFKNLRAVSKAIYESPQDTASQIVPVGHAGDF